MGMTPTSQDFCEVLNEWIKENIEKMAYIKHSVNTIHLIQDLEKQNHF